MICYIYKSLKKEGMYLYLDNKDGFYALDPQLQTLFGEPDFVMMLNLADRDALARVDISQVKIALESEGYFLQMPPKVEPLASVSK